MPFCAQCGAAVEGRFCAACGTPLADAGAGPAAQPAASGTVGDLPRNIAAALCYFLGPVTGALFLTLDPYSRDPEIRFHAWQSILLGGAGLAIYLAALVLAFLMPWFLVGVIGLLMSATSLAGVVLWLILLYQTYNGQKMVLPVVGPLAQQKAR